MAYDEGKAARVTHFIECLKHTKGEFHGKPFHLLPWQKKIIQDVFGTVREEDPSIRYRTDIKPGMWVRFRDEKWYISTLGKYGFKRKYLGLKASVSKGVSG